MLRRAFPGVYEGWIVVGSSAFVVLLVGASFYYGFGTIFNELIIEFGWSVAATSLAFSLRSEVGGLAALLVGVSIDRLGAQKVIIGGIIVSAAGVVMLSFTQQLWHFYVAMIVTAIGSSAAGGQVGLAAIATWFERRRAWAMSIMTIGGGLGGLLVVGIAWLVEEFGWRAALRVLAAVMLTTGLAIAVNVRSRPEGHPQPMDGDRAVEGGPDTSTGAAFWGIPVRHVIFSRSFILLSLGMIGLSFSTNALAVHQIPYLEREIGVSKALAGSTVAAYTVFSILGRLGMGYLADRSSKRMMLAAAAALVAAGLGVLAVADTFLVAMLGILIVAPGFGGFLPVRPALMADYYGTKHFGSLSGISALVTTAGGAFGPWLVGWLVDVTGGYTQGWYVSAAVSLVVIPLFMIMSPPRELAAQYAAETTEAPSSAGAAPPPAMH